MFVSFNMKRNLEATIYYSYKSNSTYKISHRFVFLVEIIKILDSMLSSLVTENTNVPSVKLMGGVHQNTDTVALNGAVGLGMNTMKTVTAPFNLDIRYTTKKMDS